jgi:catechol 2,3-dioxygenase-like lactoylglutathione lyase family enzyme
VLREVGMVETEGLTHVHLFVADLDRSLRFYRDVFGLEETFREGPKMVFVRPPNTSDTITLNEVPERAGTPGGIEPSKRSSAPEGVSSSAGRTHRVGRTPTFSTRTATRLSCSP